MSYLQGSGTSLDPYVIHNKDAFTYFLTNHIHTNGVYAVLCADIDMQGYNCSHLYSKYINANLDGFGYALKNLTFTAYGASYSSTYWYALWQRCYLYNVRFAAFGLSKGTSADGFLECTLENCNFPYFDACAFKYTRCVTINSSEGSRSGQSITQVGCYSAYGQVWGGFVNTTAAPYNPSQYPALQAYPDLWALDGASFPRLIHQQTDTLTQAWGVKGLTSVDAIPSSRRVRAHSCTDFNQIATSLSGEDGTFLLNCSYYQDSVFVSASDDYGILLKASTAYALNDIIHPATPNGYRYVCTQAGTSASELPAEPWATDATLVSGTAQFAPLKVNQPLIHGPIKPVLIDLLTGEPV